MNPVPPTERPVFDPRRPRGSVRARVRFPRVEEGNEGGTEGGGGGEKNRGMEGEREFVV